MGKPKLCHLSKKSPSWANKLGAALLATGVSLGAFAFITDNQIMMWIVFSMTGTGTFITRLYKKED